MLERALRRDRLVVLAATAAMLALAWGWLLLGAGTGMSPFSMTTLAFPPYAGRQIGLFPHEPWDGAYWITMLAMWWIMMIAMMTPSAAPVILLHATVTRRGRAGTQGEAPGLATPAFVAGYLAIWLVFSAAATLLEWLLERAAYVSPMWMWSESAALTGGLLMLAGAYQLTPFKAACLEGCRSPIEVLSRHWRPGAAGAFRLGIVHGAYCVGCCWALMLLLFAGGAMNLVWIAGLSLIVIVEKLTPWGRALGRALGAGLLAAGAALLLRAFSLFGG